VTPPVSTIRTRSLEIAYEATGAPDGVPVILLHGFPDDVRAYDATLEPLGKLWADAVPKCDHAAIRPAGGPRQ
jgi:pimeloyl-ACP methyl ester carboxylesterase